MASVIQLVPLTVVVLTYNEERNLTACLESVAGWAGEIFVVDSGSTDRTVTIAEQYGARIVTHPFESHAKQWNWALHHLPFRYAWVLCLDADHRVTLELRQELCELFAIRAEDDRGQARLEAVDGFYIKRRQIFRGRWIRYGGYYPKYLLKLFRHEQGWTDEKELVDHHFYVPGKITRLNSDLIEDNQNESDILLWAQKHLGYAARQAREDLLRQQDGTAWNLRPSLFGTPDQRSLWLKRIWYRLPLYVRPCLYFFYRYVLRLGFLDGKQGFLFHFLQGFWYRLLVDVILDDLHHKRELGVGPGHTTCPMDWGSQPLRNQSS
jgi:glycosyltransferase involved in cell wall biosynthesis